MYSFPGLFLTICWKTIRVVVRQTWCISPIQFPRFLKRHPLSSLREYFCLIIPTKALFGWIESHQPVLSRLVCITGLCQKGTSWWDGKLSWAEEVSPLDWWRHYKETLGPIKDASKKMIRFIQKQPEHELKPLSKNLKDGFLGKNNTFSVIFLLYFNIPLDAVLVFEHA